MRAKRSYFVLSVMVLPALYALQNPQISEPLHAATMNFLKPVLSAGQAAVRTSGNLRDSVVLFWKTFREKGTEKSRIAELESRLVRFEEVVKENERLRKLIEFASTLNQKTIAAQVIGWDTSPWRRSLLLDKGTKEGIKKDMAVVVAEGLVGRVIEAGDHSARVILLTDPDARVSAIASESRAQGVVAGDGTSRLWMIYLELDSGAAVEETVVSSGVGGTLPKGVRIGKILALKKDSDGLHLKAEIEPFVDFTKLEEVLCLGFLNRE